MFGSLKMPVHFVTAEEEYAKNKQIKREDVLNILKWLEKEEHLPKIEEIQVVLFLDACNYSCEATKRTIEKFYTARTHIPEIFANRNVKMLLPKMDFYLCAPLPELSPEGYPIIMTKLLDSSLENYDYRLTCVLNDMVCSLLYAQKGSSPGLIMIFDVDGFTLGHVMKINLSLMKKNLFYLQEAVPSKLKGFHMLNSGSAMEKVMSMCKPFIKKDVADVMHVHTKIESLYKWIPKHLLSEEYGGNAGSLRQLQEGVKQNLMDNQEFFDKLDKCVVNESKRKKKSAYLTQVLDSGTEGSFKKLEID